jgi:anti-anti-sigma factor
MSTEALLFVVKETGEPTIIAFRDWASLQNQVYHLDWTFFDYIKSECNKIWSRTGCKVLALDLTNVDFVPSSFLAVLVSLRRGGRQIELLHPSESLLESLEMTNLNELFAVRA